MKKITAILCLLSISLTAFADSGKLTVSRDFSLSDTGIPGRSGVFYNGQLYAANDFDTINSLPVGRSYCILNVVGPISNGEAVVFNRGVVFPMTKSERRTIDLAAEKITFISCYANTDRNTAQALNITGDMLKAAFGDYFTIE